MKRRIRRWWVAIALAITVTTAFHSGAVAQDESEEMSFEELIGEAKTAYEDEEYERAVDLLLAANRAQPNARLLLNVAKSHEKAGNCVDALAYYRAFVRQPDAEENLVPAAEKAIENSDECEGWDDLLAGRLEVLTTPPGATVSVDGEEIGTSPVEVAALAEGQRTVAIELEGYETHEETVNLKPDADATVTVTLKEEAEEPEVVAEPTPEPEPEPDPSDEASGVSPVVHYVIATTVALGGAGLFTVGALTDANIPTNYDQPRRDPDISQDEFDRLTTERTAAVTRAWIFYISGSALFAGGITYAAITALTTSQPEESGPQLIIGPTPGRGIGIVLSGEF